MLINPIAFSMEGPRSFQLRTLEANLMPGSAAEFLRQDFEFVDVSADHSMANDWIHRQTRWCPTCLRRSEHIYGRVGWEIRFADACAECGCWLVDQCASCGERVRWSRDSYARCGCGVLLIECSSARAPIALTHLSQALEARAMRLESVTIPLFNAHSLHQCTQLVRWLGAYGSRVNQRLPQKVLASDTLEVSWPISTFAAEVLCNWPQNFFRLLDGLKSDGVDGDKGSLQRTYKGFYRSMYRAFGGPQYKWLHDAFEDYVAEHWTGSIGRRNRRVGEGTLEKMEWIPAPAAANQLGVSTPALHHLAEQGIVDVLTYQTVSGRRFSKIRRSSLGKLASFGSIATVSLAEAASALGLKKTRLKSLLPFVCPKAVKLEPTNVWRIPKEWLEECQAIVMRLPITLVADDGQWVTLDWLFRYEAPNNQVLGLLINEILSGSIAASRNGQADFLAQVSCNRSAIVKFWNQAKAEPSSHVSLMEAAHQMRVKQEVVYALVRSGLMQVEQRDVGRRISQWVTIAELRRFSETYILARDLAERLLTSSRHVAAKLKLHGVEPVAGPGVDGCRQLVFRKSDVEIFGIRPVDLDH